VRARPDAAYDYAELFSSARHPLARDPGDDETQVITRQYLS